MNEYWNEDLAPEAVPSANCLELYNELRKRYPTENAARKALIEMVWPDGIECKECHHKFVTNDGAKSISCPECRAIVWTLAGTSFHKIRRIFPWLVRVLFFSWGLPINICEFADMADVAVSTARDMFIKLTCLLSKHMEDVAKSIHSIAFEEVIARRSVETPKQMHPRAELDSMKELVAEDSLNDLDENQRKILDVISDTPISFEAICTATGLPTGQVAGSITMLELGLFINQVAGDRYTRNYRFAREEEFPTSSIVAMIREMCQGISRRYLQNYVTYWSVITHKLTKERFFHALSNGRFPGRRWLRTYSSPMMVLVF